FIFILLAFSLNADRFFKADELKKLGLTDIEISQIEDINLKYNREKQQIYAELNLYKAKIEKELVASEVNLNEVEKILKESLEWKLKAEMLEIKKRIEIRKFIGEEKWQKITAWFKERRQNLRDKRDKNSKK
ncbi:MAG: hypothetical protein JXB50_08685, partial [Spirochaetes bacterium]|nr:hypothetical protein [Spirochaetota bacterium]